MLQIFNCDFGVKIDGVPYEFDHVAEVQIENPEKTRLTRGANGKSKVGLRFKEGLSQPKMIRIPILGMTVELKGVLDKAYNDQQRLEVYFIDRKTGSSGIGKNAVLTNQPIQLSMGETEENLRVALEFETFDYVETLKE